MIRSNKVNIGELTFPSIPEYIIRPRFRFVYAKSKKTGNAFKPIQATESVSHRVKFSRASIGLILSSLLKSSEKEFNLILSTTYCIV